MRRLAAPGAGDPAAIDQRIARPGRPPLRNLTPYEWATRMQKKVGGTLFTVADDEHGSVLKNPGCAAELVKYFNTGQVDQGYDGVPTP